MLPWQPSSAGKTYDEGKINSSKTASHDLHDGSNKT
eukprot:CAMPEP_0115131214 /NCGR_PEP_ID=MMETSP0227-20121206/52967_1 /TAXON_ID=89957 /ORGANISM="Polarella glacialis, Strain CCMP 1383" /LENGTH=35 /DNA_ID= /DNA_START= /DNA_END= /DNA_ORIENTATION=